MPPLLAGRTAIITGASRGIGAAIAARYAAEGARVVLVARTLDPAGPLAGSLRETQQRIAAAGGTALCIQADLTQPDDLARIVSETAARFGGVDILVNNAAWARFPPIWKAKPRHWQLAFQMNVIAPQILSQLIYPHMKAPGARLDAQHHQHDRRSALRRSVGFWRPVSAI